MEPFQIEIRVKSMYKNLTMTGAVAGMLALLISSPVMAEDDLDVTLDIVESPQALPEAVTKVLALPEMASDSGKLHSEKGLAIANEARTKGRAHGQAMAERGKAKAKKPDTPPGRP